MAFFLVPSEASRVQGGQGQPVEPSGLLCPPPWVQGNLTPMPMPLAELSPCQHPRGMGHFASYCPNSFHPSALSLLLHAFLALAECPCAGQPAFRLGNFGKWQELSFPSFSAGGPSLPSHHVWQQSQETADGDAAGDHPTHCKVTTVSWKAHPSPHKCGFG